MTQISRYIICFAIYSIIGWAYETIVCSIEARKLVKRGFLHGPYCPIYGTGAMACVLLFSGISNIPALFAAGMVVTSAIEYFTSWAMEKLFYARWWDYSDRRFNLNGRICLLGAVVFGAMTVLLIRFIHPAVYALTGRISGVPCITVACVFLALFTADTVFTVMHINALNGKLRELQARTESALEEYKTRAKENVGELKSNLQADIKTRTEKIKLSKDNLRISIRDRRLLRSFPKFKSTRYSAALNEMKNEWMTRISQRRGGKK